MDGDGGTLMLGAARGTTVAAQAWAKLEQIVEAVLVLKVTVVVGAVTASHVAEPGVDTAVAVAAADQVVTHLAMNTALGDTTLVLSPAALADPALLAMHKDAVANALRIRAETVEVLKSVAKGIAERAGA